MECSGTIKRLERVEGPSRPRRGAPAILPTWSIFLEVAISRWPIKDVVWEPVPWGGETEVGRVLAWIIANGKTEACLRLGSYLLTSSQAQDVGHGFTANQPDLS